MKTLSTLFFTVTLFFISTSVFACSYRYDLDKIIGIYSDGIDNFRPGVSESCILYIAQMKLTYPDENYSSVLKKLDFIAKNDSSQAKRLKALIARNCILNPEKYAWIKTTSHEEMCEFCKMLLNGYAPKVSIANY